MAFLTINDFYSRVTANIVDQIIQGDDTVITQAEIVATGLVTDRLCDRYNVEDELSKADAARNNSLLRWMLSLAVYSLYSRVPDSDIPERVTKDYDDTVSELEKISTGKLSCTLSRVIDASGTVRTRMRIGSNPPRTHNPY